MISNILIAVSGGSASGKTTVAKKLAAMLGDEAVVFEMDSYYKDLSHLSNEDREKVNFDHPQAMDLGLFKEHLRALKQGKPIEKPLYNFHTHAHEKKTETFMPQRIIIAEGLFVLHEDIQEHFDYKIFIDTPEEVRLHRRLERDVKERGRDRESVIKQYHATVKPMHTAFVQPSSKHADVVVGWEKEDLVTLEKIVKQIRGIIGIDTD